jgi:hypothetical protein
MKPYQSHRFFIDAMRLVPWHGDEKIAIKNEDLRPCTFTKSIRDDDKIDCWPRFHGLCATFHTLNGSDNILNMEAVDLKAKIIHLKATC